MQMGWKIAIALFNRFIVHPSTAIVPAITDNNDTKQQAARLRAGIIRAKANTVPIPVTKPIFYSHNGRSV